MSKSEAPQVIEHPHPAGEVKIIQQTDKTEDAARKARHERNKAHAESLKRGWWNPAPAKRAKAPKVTKAKKK